MFKRRRPGNSGSFNRKSSQSQSRAIPPMLLQAHRLYSWRQYLPAADLYERLAEGALTREPSRAPLLFLQTGWARIAGGQVETGIEQIRRGLELLNTQQRFRNLHRVSWRVIQGLENNGLEQQADQIRAWLIDLKHSEEIPEWGTTPQTAIAKVRLPLSCPSCGGVVDPSEVDWVDELTAQCGFCGTMLHGEEA
jgi:hypothetical protein